MLGVLAVAVSSVSVITSCLPVDANPSHVTVGPGACETGSATWCLRNRTSYAVRVDGQTFMPTPTVPTAFSPAVVVAGKGAQATYAYDPIPCTGQSVKVQFTLIGAKQADGSPVTGEAKFAIVGCPVS